MGALLTKVFLSTSNFKWPISIIRFITINITAYNAYSTTQQVQKSGFTNVLNTLLQEITVESETKEDSGQGSCPGSSGDEAKARKSKSAKTKKVKKEKTPEEVAAKEARKLAKKKAKALEKKKSEKIEEVKVFRITKVINKDHLKEAAKDDSVVSDKLTTIREEPRLYSIKQ